MAVPSAIESVLKALNDSGVRYLVVGGIAVVMHGHLRTTADLDLVVDLFVREPFDFDAVYARAARAQLDTTTATVIALEDLVALKRAAGRPQDLADIDALERLRGDA